MNQRLRFVSVDDHVIETPNLWSDRMDASWGARIPRLETAHDGTDSWVIDGQQHPLATTASVGAFLPDRAAGPRHWDDIPKSAYVPWERLLAMDAGSIDVSVLYPMVAGVAGQRFGSLDAEFELACVAAYNDWLLDEWAATSDRFVPQCITPVASIESAVDEIRRSVGKGHRGVVMPANPALLRPELPHVNEPDYDPVWALCAELDVPVCFHSGSSPLIQMPPYEDYSDATVAALEAMTRPVSSTFLLANLLFSGILRRHPTLKVVFAETSLAWGAYTLESSDHQFGRQRYDLAGWDVIPTEQFHRQCFLTGWYDRTGAATRHVIGVDNMLWSSNLPQATSPWPDIQQTVERCLGDIPEGERAKILADNATALYKL